MFVFLPRLLFLSWRQLTLLLGLLYLSLTVAAGGGALDGGGGRSVVCRNKSKKITSATLLDLYEGRIQFGYSYPKPVNTVDSYLSAVSTLIKNGTRVPINFYFDSVQKNIKLLPSGTALNPINDSHEFILPTSCKVEQVANFVNPKMILVVGDIWAKFDNLNRAALIAHEALYWKARGLGATDSRRSRYMVSYLFSQNASLEDVYDGIDKASISCISMTKKSGEEGNQISFFYLVSDKDRPDRYGLQFTILGGTEVFSKKILWLYKDIIDKILYYSEHSFSPGIDKVGEGSSTATTVSTKFEEDDIVQIMIKNEKHPDANYTWTRLYLSGQSGWNPSGKFESAVFTCNKNNFIPIPDKN